MRTLQLDTDSRWPGLARAILSGALGLAFLLGLMLLVGASGSAAQGPPPPDIEPPRWPESAEVSRLLETIRAAVPPAPVAAQAAVTICVDPGNPGCFPSIQAAIDAASPGTIIEVAAGTYPEHITMTDGVSIYGADCGWPSGLATVIDGGYTEARPVVYVPPGVSASTVLSGVQVTGGGTATPGDNQGGGLSIWHASPRIINTMVYSCTAREGGGVLVWIGQPSFENVAVLGCRATNYGGGYHLQDADVSIIGDPFDQLSGAILLNTAANVQGGGIYMSGGTALLGGLSIYWNSAPQGGGVCISSASTGQAALYLNDIAYNSADRGGGLSAIMSSGLDVVLNVIRSNTAEYGGGGAWFNQVDGSFAHNIVQENGCAHGSGGGVDVSSGSAGLLVQYNLFQSNTSTGGALGAETGAAPTVDANTFVSNTSNIGGAVYTYQAGEVKVTNNIMARNVASAPAVVGGGVVIVETPVHLINNTIADNTGDGVWFSAAHDAVIANNILSGNSGHGLERDIMTTTTRLVADYNDFYLNTAGARSGVAAGDQDLLVDPGYVAPSGLNYHIQASSPVSQTGSTAWAPLRDFDGERRRTRGTVSIGADEIPAPPKLVFLPLVLKNSP